MRGVLGLVWLVATGCASPADGSPKAEPASDAVKATPDGAVTGAPVATWEGGSITLADVEKRVAGQLTAMERTYRMQRYEQTSQALTQMVDEALLTAEAERKSMTIEGLLEKEVEEKAGQPSEAEVVALYEQAKGQLGGAPLEEVRGMVVGELRRPMMEKLYNGYIAELRKKAKAKVTYSLPDDLRVAVPVAEHDPDWGKAGAPVTIVQFAEYQCYYCGVVSPTIAKLRKEYGDKIHFVYKDYPLPSHSLAMGAAVAGHCAGEQGKYWEMNEAMLSNQRALDPAGLQTTAKALGLDTAKWSECVASGKYEPTIREDAELGNSVGVNATPTFFINGVMLAGAQPYERFASVIEQELSR